MRGEDKTRALFFLRGKKRQQTNKAQKPKSPLSLQKNACRIATLNVVFLRSRPLNRLRLLGVQGVLLRSSPQKSYSFPLSFIVRHAAAVARRRLVPRLWPLGGSGRVRCKLGDGIALSTRMRTRNERLRRRRPLLLGVGEGGAV